MMKQKKPVSFILIFSGIILFIILLMQPLEVWHFRGDIDILFPKGPIALKQRNLLLIIQAIMLLVVIPVYILTFLFSWRYRAHNKKAKYAPDWDDNRLAEYIWWGVPCLLVLIIGTLTWIRTYELDPLKPLAAPEKTMKIQVVALQWKWLFIYPEEKIATVNFVQFPENTPIHFEITSDAPMNSFWIPRLGGQIYAMPKMKTALHLIADEPGDYDGYSANLSGAGFAGMHFIARASTEADFHKWVETAHKSSLSLNLDSYKQLALPSQNNPAATYLLKDNNLFDAIIMKYMQPPQKVNK
ncbi:ubiquinol oxidase subunit II [Chlamydiota bacterium]